MHSKDTASVTVDRAMYGMPATVAVIDGRDNRVVAFNVGHVFTDNANATEYAWRVAAELGCSVEVWS